MSVRPSGRFTVEPGQEVTVFLIGMRFGKPWRIDKWWPVATAMPRMLARLEREPDLGLLGYHQWFGRTTLLLSYWQSPAHLQRFASAADQPHVGPWRRFMARAAGDPAVGIWHETYSITPGHYEVVYANMPPFGLGRALGQVPVRPGLRTAAQRLHSSSGPTPPS